TAFKVLSSKVTEREAWKAAEINELVNVLVEEKKQGHCTESGFQKQSYWCAAEALSKLGYMRTGTQCKTCWGWVKGQYKIVKTLPGQSGFGWNEKNKVVTASEEVWKAYLAAPITPKPGKGVTFVTPATGRAGCFSMGAGIAALAGAVSSLATALNKDPSSMTDSPACTKCAWDLAEKEDLGELSDEEYSVAVRVFSKTQAADEYLRFPANRKKAHCIWLQDAIASIQKIL
ncbi:hypothetical protein DXG01_005798, partial [Tephrocybe rancida]